MNKNYHEYNPSSKVLSEKNIVMSSREESSQVVMNDPRRVQTEPNLENIEQ